MLFDTLTEVLDPEPHGAALNMALDEVLLRSASEPLLRIYRWKQPAVSFGYFGNFAEVARKWPEREWVRRWTGGGIVPHGEDLTYTLIVPRGHAFFRVLAAESYAVIHARLGELLKGAGSPVRLAEAAAAKVSNACFENAVQHDLVADGGKIAGAAQRRTAAGLLHQGSIQQVTDRAALTDGLGRAFAKAVSVRSLALEELAEAARLAEEKYASEAWLRRYP